MEYYILIQNQIYLTHAFDIINMLVAIYRTGRFNSIHGIPNSFRQSIKIGECLVYCKTGMFRVLFYSPGLIIKMISIFKITYFQPCSQKIHNLFLTFFDIYYLPWVPPISLKCVQMLSSRHD